MEEKHRMILLGVNIPYTLEDLSVVIPHASWYKRRLPWFLERYFKGTPAEVIRNTIIVCDPGDEYSFELARKYEIQAIPNEVGNRDYSTLKLLVGFEKVKTRLCVRMHNDAHVLRDDWAHILIGQFNSTDKPQMIGERHPSAEFTSEIVDKLTLNFPWYSQVKNHLEYANQKISVHYFHAYFMASQTYIMRDIYKQVVKFNEDKMDKEDCLFSQLVSSYNVQMIAWLNLREFIRCVSSKTDDFEATEQIDLSMPVNIIEENRNNYQYPVMRILPD